MRDDVREYLADPEDADVLEPPRVLTEARQGAPLQQRVYRPKGLLALEVPDGDAERL